MTVAPPSYTHQSTLNSSLCYNKTSTAPMPRRGSLQETMRSATGCSVPRRSSLSSISKPKQVASLSAVVVVMDKTTTTATNDHEFAPPSPPQETRSETTSTTTTTTTTPSDGLLQSADKRRRYMRRGSKTSFMMRASCKMDLPPEWQATLTKAITRRVRNVSSSSSSSSTLLDASTMSNSDHSSSQDSYGSTSPSPSSRFSRSSSLPVTTGDDDAASMLLCSSTTSSSRSFSRNQSTVSLLTSALELSCGMEDPSMAAAIMYGYE